ncbi:MAG: ABC transporter permease [Bacteroidaceae bacterium]|nr:ABC transporter permease [Bacteroidaceae bacterium]
MSFALFIAKRIYSDGKGGKRFSRPAVRIAMMGIAVGLAVMIISLSVVLGFQREVSNKVIGFGSHIQVVSLTQTHEYEMMPVLTNDSLRKVVSSYPGIRHMQKFAVKLGILKTEDDFCGVTFKGVGEDYDTTFFHKYLVEGEIPKFSSKEASQSIVISRKIAGTLGVKLGDKMYSYFMDKESGMRVRRFTVKGIYETNLEDYDKMNVLTDIYTVRKLNGWTEEMSSGYELMVDDFDNVSQLAAAIHNDIYGPRDRNGVVYGAFSIKELSPHTFAWLSVLDMNVVMILILMLCVSSFTIVSGLLIIMLERINMIGVLKALGATNMDVRRIFIHYAVMLVGKGIVIGDILGLAICFVQQYFAVVKLDASVYYLDSVPIHIDWLKVVGLNILTLIISSLVIFGSTFFIGINKPAKTMKFE